jgi:hypothetical protein
MKPTDERRQLPRKSLFLNAKVRIGSHRPFEAVVSDITTHGCSIAKIGQPYDYGVKVYIRPEGLEGVLGTIRWAVGGKLGVEFDAPLYGPVVDHLLRLHSGFG